MPPLIFWIEDDSYIIRSLLRPLDDRGFDIRILETMQEALDNVDALRKCNLILLDVILPAGIEGLTSERNVGVLTLQKLRDQGVSVPVLALTVVDNDVVWDQLRELGVEAILTKPVMPDILEAKVLEILKIQD